MKFVGDWMKCSRLFVLFVLLCSLFIFSSCSRSSDVSGNVVELTYPSKYAGPRIASTDISPRSSITENSPFYLVLTFENQGSQDMRDASVRVYGYDRFYTEVDDADPDSFEIVAYDEESPVVLSKEVEVKGYANLLSSDEPSHDVTLFLETEFMYSTVLDQSVCINPSAYDVYGGCANPEPDKAITANAQYSPVAVTTFEQNVFERESVSYFTFHIENKGNGEVDQIFLKDARLTLDNLEECGFVGNNKKDMPKSDLLTYVFEDGEKAVDLVCEYHFSGLKSASTKSLYLEFLYKYRFVDDVKFTIVPSRR